MNSKHSSFTGTESEGPNSNRKFEVKSPKTTTNIRQGPGWSLKTPK